MSVITEMVIYLDESEDEAMANLNDWCRENDTVRHQEFRFISGIPDEAGGSKYFTGEIWAMAGNHFPYKELIDAFPGFDWRQPEKTILIVNHENEDSLRLIAGDFLGKGI